MFCFGSWCCLSILMGFPGPALLCSLLSSGEFGLLQFFLRLWWKLSEPSGTHVGCSVVAARQNQEHNDGNVMRLMSLTPGGHIIFTIL